MRGGAVSRFPDYNAINLEGIVSKGSPIRQEISDTMAMETSLFVTNAP